MAITDRVVEGMAAWQSWPLDPVIFIDCVNVKIRDGNVANQPIYVALAVTCEGSRDILGLWAGEHSDGEGSAQYWMRVLSEIKNRGTQDCLIVVCDGLKGLPSDLVRRAILARLCLAEQLEQPFGDDTSVDSTATEQPEPLWPFSGASVDAILADDAQRQAWRTHGRDRLAELGAGAAAGTPRPAVDFISPDDR